MGLFFKTFIKIFAILSSILIFFVVLIALSTFTTKVKNNKIFTHTSGDITSQNKIAVLKLAGPILNEPYLISDYQLFNNVNIIYVNKIKKNIKKVRVRKNKRFNNFY